MNFRERATLLLILSLDLLTTSALGGILNISPMMGRQDLAPTTMPARGYYINNRYPNEYSRSAIPSYDAEYASPYLTVGEADSSSNGLEGARMAFDPTSYGGYHGLQPNYGYGSVYHNSGGYPYSYGSSCGYSGGCGGYSSYYNYGGKSAALMPQAGADMMENAMRAGSPEFERSSMDSFAGFFPKYMSIPPTNSPPKIIPYN